MSRGLAFFYTSIHIRRGSYSLRVTGGGVKGNHPSNTISFVQAAGWNRATGTFLTREVTLWCCQELV